MIPNSPTNKVRKDNKPSLFSIFSENSLENKNLKSPFNSGSNSGKLFPTKQNSFTMKQGAQVTTAAAAM